MSKCRLRFIKTGRARYISHLDLMRTFQRAFQRAGIKIKHTEGFNPHAYISIALPLSLGCESLCEILDIDTIDDFPISSLPERLNPYLPEGILISDAKEPVKKASSIKYLRCSSILTYDMGETDHIIDKIRELFEKSEITIIKKTKRGQSEFDLKPFIKSMEVSIQNDNNILLEAVISAQNPTINPSHLVQAIIQLAPELSPSFSSDARNEIYDEEMVIFV